MALAEIRCPSCLGVVGLARKDNGNAVFCSTYCAEDFRVSANEERDALIDLLAAQGRSAFQITLDLDLDISRQAVSQIIERRQP